MGAAVHSGGRDARPVVRRLTATVAETRRCPELSIPVWDVLGGERTPFVSGSNFCWENQTPTAREAALGRCLGWPGRLFGRVSVCSSGTTH